MKALRDWAAAAVFLSACCALLYWCGGGGPPDELTSTRRIIKQPTQTAQPQPIPLQPPPPIPLQPPPPIKMATCCKPACKSPEKCDEKSCICTRNAGPALPPGKDAGAAFMLIFDPGPIEPGDPPSCAAEDVP